MYDRLNLWSSYDTIGNKGYIDTVPLLLSNISTTKKTNGLEWINGQIRNLLVSVSELGISIKGSPNKFVHGYNFAKLTRQETELFIEELSDLFHLNVGNSKVNKIDLSHNFIMKENVQNYFHLLGNAQYYKRQAYENSIYYRNQKRTILFYDKIKEGKKKGESIPLIWQNKNVLRYELRYTQRLLNQFNRLELLANDLYNEDFYISIIDNWILEYQKINKNMMLEPIKENITNRDAKEYLLSFLIEEKGQNYISELVKSWEHKFSTTKEVQRFKKSLQNLAGFTIESDLIKELDYKISSIKDHYR